MLKKIKSADASAAELRMFAEQTLGLGSLNKSLNRPQIVAKIAEVGELPDEIEVDDRTVATPAPAGITPAVPPRAAMRAFGSRGDPRVELYINEQSDEEGKRAVPVSVNGQTILLPRGEWFECAYRYYEALKNAKETTYREGRDGELVDTSQHKYPFQFRNMPTADEVAAWEAGNAERFAA